MKHTLLLFALLAIVSCGGTKGKENKKLHYDEVYVCTGRYAKRFHCDEDCRGLQSCRGDIVVMSIEDIAMYIKQKINIILERGIVPNRECLRLMLGFYTEEDFVDFLDGKKVAPTVCKKIDDLLNK